MENRVRKITSAAAWLVSSSISTICPSMPLRRAAAASDAVPHRRKRIAQAAAFKRRINDPALSLPCLTIGQEHGIAQQGAQPFADPVGLWEIIGPRFEHFFDQFRLVQSDSCGKTECEIQPSMRDTTARVGLTGCLGETIAYSAKATLCSGDFGVWAVGSCGVTDVIFGHSIIDA